MKDKARQQAQAAAAGYELTIGTTTEGFCKNFLAPNLSEDKRLCVAQVESFP